jgi:hypothetical protein
MSVDRMMFGEKEYTAVIYKEWYEWDEWVEWQRNLKGL